MRTELQLLPVVPLRQSVLFPGPPVSLTIGRKAARAFDGIAGTNGLIFVVTQREDEIEEPDPEQLYSIGVVARLGHVHQGFAGVQVAVSGLDRAKVLEFRRDHGTLRALVRIIETFPPLDEQDPAFLALFREVRERGVELAKLRGLSEDLLQEVVQAVTEPGQFSDLVAAYMDIPVADKQALLETIGAEERLRGTLLHLQRQINLAETQANIRSQVQEELGGRQKEIYLREQMRVIQKELGEGGPVNEALELRRKLDQLELPEEAKTEADRELGRLERSGPDGMESQVIRTYLRWITELPWNIVSEDRLDVEHAASILDEDHYGLGDVKDRILEFLSVRQLKARSTPRAEPSESKTPGSPQSGTSTADKAKTVATGPILLFVGPPGVGKTSIAHSIARALNRKYVRASLGGIRDEADIRGHRRTYVGAMPGRIVQGMRHTKTMNPVFLLDEVDKLGVSFQGDPASALLEVLDPAQNSTFTDHYLGVPFDLSQVLFIATANVTHTIPPALLDRMEVVEFAGYTELEKIQIARQYLVRRQLEQAALSERVEIGDDAIAAMIGEYTRESGVRQLERQLAAIARKMARKVASGKPTPSRVTRDVVHDLLGRARVHPEHASESDEIGVATGMYYSQTGGDIMFVEAAIRPTRRPAPGALAQPASSDEGGNVALILTGQLGDVMKESARAALTYTMTHSEATAVPAGSSEAHVHVPAGAIPKDGPSAGVTIATALASAITGRKVHGDLAMSGEVTLRGRVLPIGGVKEKVLGAHRAGIRRVVLPIDNEPNLDDVPPDVRADLVFHWVSTLDEVLALALAPVECGVRDRVALAR